MDGKGPKLGRLEPWVVGENEDSGVKLGRLSDASEGLLAFFLEKGAILAVVDGRKERLRMKRTFRGNSGSITGKIKFESVVFDSQK